MPRALRPKSQNIKQKQYCNKFNEDLKMVHMKKKKKTYKKLKDALGSGCVLSLCDPVDCSPPGSSVHGILQARILE